MLVDIPASTRPHEVMRKLCVYNLLKYQSDSSHRSRFERRFSRRIPCTYRHKMNVRPGKSAVPFGGHDMHFHRLRHLRPPLIRASDTQVAPWRPPFGPPERLRAPATSRFRQRAKERRLRGDSGWQLCTLIYRVSGSTGRSDGWVLQGESLSSTMFVSDGDEQKTHLIEATLGISLTELTRQHSIRHYH